MFLVFDDSSNWYNDGINEDAHIGSNSESRSKALDSDNDWISVKQGEYNC